MPCTAAGQFNKLRYPVTPRSPVRATELGALSPEAGSARTAASSGHIMCNRPPNQTPADRASVQALMLFSRLSSAAGLYAAQNDLFASFATHGNPPLRGTYIVMTPWAVGALKQREACKSFSSQSTSQALRPGRGTSLWQHQSLTAQCLRRCARPMGQ